MALGLSGCAGMVNKPEPPRLTLAGFELRDAGLMEQRFALRLRVQNPNDFKLAIKALDYRLDLNDQPFASGLSNQPVTIDSFGTELIEVEAYSDIFGMLRRIKDYLRSDRKFVYRLTGNAVLSEPRSRKLPFEHSGELNWAQAYKE